MPSDAAPLAALGTVPYPGVKTNGKVTVCKDAASPAGSYHFHVTATGTQSGDLLSASATLTPGTCSVVFERAAAGGTAATITIIEEILPGATFRLDHITAVDDLGTRTLAGPGVSFTVSGNHGAVATFFNVALTPPPPPPGLPQMTTFPGTETPGQVKVCKAGTVTGNFTFNISATGTVAGDQVATSATLASGQCAIVFIRTVTSTQPATLTVTEVAQPGTTLSSITRIQAGVTSTITGTSTATVFENTFHGGVLTFNNVPSATTNFGLGQAAFPGTETPGQAKVCKSATSPAGLYTFNITAANTVAGDQVAPTITIGPGQCAIIFIRTTASTTFATLTVTEVVPSGMSVTQIVRTQFGTTTTLTGTATATISENFFHGGVLTYTNAHIVPIG